MKVLGLIVSIVVLSHSAFAQTGLWNGGPRVFSYQGEMRDKNGTVIPDGQHFLLIELYASTGSTPVYSEQKGITFHNGIFDLVVGDAFAGIGGNPPGELPETLKFDRPYWIQITFEPGGMNEQKFPRTLIESAPYALNAERVNGIAASAAPIAGNIFPLPMINGRIDPAILPPQPNSIQLINTVGPNGIGSLNIVGSSGIDVSNSPSSNTITISGAALQPQPPGTGATSIAVGTTAQRPSAPTVGMIRFNTTTTKFEGYDGTNWVDLN